MPDATSEVKTQATVASKRVLESAPEKPKALPVNPDGIPTELKERDQWVCWAYRRRNGRWTKPPINTCTGRNAEPDDPSTWATFAEAPALLDVRGVARLLEFSPRHVYRLADGGLLPPPLRLEALVRWRRSDIETWLAQGCPRVRPVRRAQP
jgi:predicted DNA-binding transcriptional regulator AlpA